MQSKSRSIRILLIAATVLVLAAGTILAVSYLGSRSSANRVTVIKIPEGAGVQPRGFNVTNLLNGRYHYPWNDTVVIGVNNTLTWVNEDNQQHTVSSFIVPAGATAFNSDLIKPGQRFTLRLDVPGVYRYTCMWHPWLAGEIIVRSG